MRAVVYQGNQQFAIRDLGDPASAHGQVVVDGEFCAICGTDVHAVMHDFARVGSALATFNAPAPAPDTHHRVSLSSLPHPPSPAYNPPTTGNPIVDAKLCRRSSSATAVSTALLMRATEG